MDSYNPGVIVTMKVTKKYKRRKLSLSIGIPPLTVSTNLSKFSALVGMGWQIHKEYRMTVKIECNTRVLYTQKSRKVHQVKYNSGRMTNNFLYLWVQTTLTDKYIFTYF